MFIWHKNILKQFMQSLDIFRLDFIVHLAYEHSQKIHAKFRHFRLDIVGPSLTCHFFRLLQQAVFDTAADDLLRKRPNLQKSFRFYLATF